MHAGHEIRELALRSERPETHHRLPGGKEQLLQRIVQIVAAAEPSTFTFHGDDHSLLRGKEVISFPVFHGREAYVGIGSDPLTFDAESAVYFPQYAVGGLTLTLDDGNALHLLKLQPITQGEEDYGRRVWGRGGDQPGEGYFVATPAGEPSYVALITGQSRGTGERNSSAPLLFRSSADTATSARVQRLYEAVLSVQVEDDDKLARSYSTLCRRALQGAFTSAALQALTWTKTESRGAPSGSCERTYKAARATPAGVLTLEVHYEQDGKLFGQPTNPKTTLQVEIDPKGQAVTTGVATEIANGEIARALGTKESQIASRALRAAREQSKEE